MKKVLTFTFASLMAVSAFGQVAGKALEIYKKSPEVQARENQKSVERAAVRGATVGQVIENGAKLNLKARLLSSAAKIETRLGPDCTAACQADFHAMANIAIKGEELGLTNAQQAKGVNGLRVLSENSGTITAKNVLEARNAQGLGAQIREACK